MDARKIQQSAKHERRNKNDPEPHQAMRQVELPAPFAALHEPEDAAADQVPAQHKKDDHRLMACIGHDIRHGKQSAMPGNLPIIDVQQITPMLKTNEQRRNGAYKVEQHGRAGARERNAGGRVHRAASTLQRSSKLRELSFNHSPSTHTARRAVFLLVWIL